MDRKKFLTLKLVLMEQAFHAACETYCSLRADGLCDLDCPGRTFGRVSGLIPIQVFDAPNPDQPPDPGDHCDWLPKL